MWRADASEASRVTTSGGCPSGSKRCAGRYASSRTPRTPKAVQIYRGDAIDPAALLAMFRAVIANNRGGGWRRIQASAHQSPPPGPANP